MGGGSSLGIRHGGELLMNIPPGWRSTGGTDYIKSSRRITALLWEHGPLYNQISSFLYRAMVSHVITRLRITKAAGRSGGISPNDPAAMDRIG
jgi:hypothetical protein